MLKKVKGNRVKIEKRNIPNDQYKKIIELLPICAVDVIFFDEKLKKTLLFKRKNKPLSGFYYSCGGRLYKNEHFTDGAKRKIFEETGLTIKKEKLFFGGVSNEIFSDSVYKNINSHTVVVYFGYILKKSDCRKLILDSQHNRFKWFNVKDDKLQPYLKEKIRNCLKYYE